MSLPSEAQLKDTIRNAAIDIEGRIGDGTPFFDAMDEWLAQDDFFLIQRDRFERVALPGMSAIIVSGRWGRRFFNWYTGPAMVVCVPGNLRHEPLEPFPRRARTGQPAFEGVPFIMLDNSSYKNRTRDQIRDRIAEAGGLLFANLVLYDGTHEPDPDVYGLFRYFGDLRAPAAG